MSIDRRYRLLKSSVDVTDLVSSSGAVIPPALIGTGTADSSTFLRGDSTWARGIISNGVNTALTLTTNGLVDGLHIDATGRFSTMALTHNGSLRGQHFWDETTTQVEYTTNLAGAKHVFIAGNQDSPPTTMDSTGSWLVNGAAAVGTTQFQVVNTRNVADGDNARIQIAGGGSALAIFGAGTVTSTPIITNGPTGAQTVIRNLGTYPMVFGVGNALAMTLSNGGSLTTVAGISAGSASVILPVATTAFTAFMGDSASVGLRILDPGTNATEFRINTNNAQSLIQALGTTPRFDIFIGGASKWTMVAAATTSVNPVTLPTMIATSVATAGAAGQIVYGSTTAATATTGAAGAPPAQVVGYIIIGIAGTLRKIPFYAT